MGAGLKPKRELVQINPNKTSKFAWISRGTAQMLPVRSFTIPLSATQVHLAISPAWGDEKIIWVNTD
jgi:hypothetical protein